MPRTEPVPKSGRHPRISVVMPVFNAAPFLAASIGSVLGQTLDDWELILVDDGSSDESPQLCAEYARRHPGIRFLAQRNAGPSAARNAGVEAADGDFIFFLDADDSLPPDALRHLLSAADERDADFVLGNFLKQENEGAPLPQPVIFSPGNEAFHGGLCELSGDELVEYVRHFLNHPSNHLVSYCWGRLYRRTLIVRHGLRADENMRLFEDFAFNLSFLGKARRLVFVNQPVYRYVLRSGHVSASMAILDAGRLAADMEAFCVTIERFLDELGVNAARAKQVRRESGHALVHYAIIFIIRSCRQRTPATKARIDRELRAFINAPVLREALSCYTPRPGNSRLLPLLMRLKLVRPLAVIAKARSEKRYGKLPNGAT